MASISRKQRDAIPLVPAQIPSSTPTGPVDARAIAEQVLDALNQALLQKNYSVLTQLFVEDGFWRDHLALSWEFRTLQGHDDIVGFLQACTKSRDGFRLKNLTLDASGPSKEPSAVPFDPDAKTKGVQAFFAFETAIGSGRGVMRLVFDREDWKIFTFYTSLQQLKGFEEAVYHRRPRGVEFGDSQPGKNNWAEKLERRRNFEDGSEPAVLVVGGGQGGLAMAARLEMLGVNTLVIDRNKRIGDNWRGRYRHLVLHDPVWYDHMPYINFPPQWPIFSPKDKLAGFLESYAELLELNVWLQTELESCEWDRQTERWTATVLQKSDGGTRRRTFHPHHIIQATGLSGLKHEPSFKGMDTFKGSRICHSSEFPGAQRVGQQGSKKAVIVGSCNSAHDIAQDFFENGYDVTIVQRSSTHVVSVNAILGFSMKGVYEEDGPPVEDADMLVQGLPSSILKTIHIKLAEHIKKYDEETLSGLEKAGFKVNEGPDGAGLFFQYFEHSGGYYIDVGTSKLIADGNIKCKQGQEVVEILPHGVRLADGLELEADEIIFATGYQNMRSQTRYIFGDAVADSVDDVWEFNEEGEFRTIWQQSGHPGFWYHGGNLGQCRFYSRLLALQIKAIQEGLCKYGEM
ncbi:hypothetical protein CDD81_705 [Ophiocordyceps australis]|uniref:FAD/NAD(P)-binding domain-containing protein n=1 Tax=Ophiocordyceps australis TaxID=1399860 RepID=A0A2C5Y1S6_9HYPO|nr:hypothetical protein CDD81_705 [Ophiocordyceps australis]